LFVIEELVMKTVRKALAILDSFTRYNKIQGVTEISSKLNINKSTTHAILSTLREEGYVIYEGKTRKYSLGFKPFELADRIVYKSDIRDLALPVMERLSKTSNEDVVLNIQVEGKRVCVALVESQYFVRQFVPVGKALPLHCSAAGKVLLAYLSRKEIDAIIEKYGLPRFTPRTITQKSKLFAELEKTKRMGYGESREEYGRDAAALAFPIFNGKGEMVACVSIQSTVTRLVSDAKKRFIQMGLLAAKEISRKLCQGV
jgi:IclR family transcriptional regulator, KDG regulon repressor